MSNNLENKKHKAGTSVTVFRISQRHTAPAVSNCTNYLILFISSSTNLFDCKMKSVLLKNKQKFLHP